LLGAFIECPVRGFLVAPVGISGIEEVVVTAPEIVTDACTPPN